MSFPKRVPSTALLAALRRTTQTPCLRTAATHQMRWESTEKESPGHGKSFSGQLYTSTAMRLQKEKADRERFSKLRNESSGGRDTAITFGTANYTILLDEEMLITSLDSGYFRCARWILFRYSFRAYVKHSIHSPNKRNNTT